MQDKKADLSKYRLNNAKETLQVAVDCYNNDHLRDAINRAYYAAFYSAKSILAIDEVDFKRHKDVVAYFNKEYVSTGKISKETGKMLARLQQKREKSDYDDFYIASKEEAEEQIKAAEIILREIENFLTSEL